MLKLIGALLLAGGAGALGCSAAAQLSRRVAVLRALLGALEGMEREIAFRLTPMPELLERAAAESPPPVCTLFARCRTLLDELGERSMAELWREALEQVPLGLDGWPWRSWGRCWAAMTGTGSGKHSPTPVRSCPGRWSRPGRPGKNKGGCTRCSVSRPGHSWLSCCCEGACDMDVDLIFKIAAIGILVSVLNQVLSRSGRDEQATMTTLAGLVVVLMMVVQQISGLFELVKNLFGL